MRDSRRDNVSPEEWRVRVDLAAAYRLTALEDWDDLVFTHITARVPGEESFLINPYGLMFEEVTASSLVKIDAAGNKLSDSSHPVNPTGFTIHGCIHTARPDARCVMHTHATNGVAVSAQREGLLPISQQASMVLPSLAYHDYEGIALLDEEKPRLVNDLGDKRFLMLRNHGLLTVGATVADAFVAMYLFEAACTIQLRAQAAKGSLVSISPDVLAMAQTHSAKATPGGDMGALVWPGLVRRLDRVNPGYNA